MAMPSRATGYGIEVEFFGMEQDVAQRLISSAGISVMAEDYNHETRDYWKIVNDGSVAGEGNELVSPILIFEDGIHRNTRLALNALRFNGGQVDRTCGLHIHHDARNMSPAEIAATYGLYALFQPVINSFLPSSRHNGEYCQSLNQDHAEWAEGQAVMHDDWTDRNAFHNERYLAINTGALRVHGTLEFRQHSGTLNPLKVTHWKRFTKAMMVSGRRLNYHAVVNPFGSWDAAQRELNIYHMADLFRLPADTIDYLVERKDHLQAGTENPSDDGEDLKANVEADYYTGEDRCAGCGETYDWCECSRDDSGDWRREADD